MFTQCVVDQRGDAVDPSLLLQQPDLAQQVLLDVRGHAVLPLFEWHAPRSRCLSDGSRRHLESCEFFLRRQGRNDFRL